MQTAFIPNIIPTKRAEPSKNIEKYLWKKLSFLLNGKNKKKIYFFYGKYQNSLSHALEISVISRVRSTSEITDIFNTFNEIYLVFTPKK